MLQAFDPFAVLAVCELGADFKIKAESRWLIWRTSIFQSDDHDWNSQQKEKRLDIDCCFPESMIDAPKDRGTSSSRPVQAQARQHGAFAQLDESCGCSLLHL